MARSVPPVECGRSRSDLRNESRRNSGLFRGGTAAAHVSLVTRRREAMSIEIRFWGVRGSIASPGPETAEVGGNTSCVEVVARSSNAETRLILDGGTGMRRLGNALLARGPVEATVLLSHVHWDHIQ